MTTASRSRAKQRPPKGTRRVQTTFSVGITLLCVVGVFSCRSKTQQQLDELNLSEQEAKRILAEVSAKRAANAPTRTTPPKAPEPPPPTPQAASDEIAPHSEVSDWIVDELVDVAPAAPSTATHRGVVVINGENELLLARLGSLSTSHDPQPSPIVALDDSQGPFALGRGPSVAGDYAYWVTSHYLLRRSLRNPRGPLQILTRDARVGTRAAAQLVSYPGRTQPWVGYVALPEEKDGPLRAKLWFDDGSTEKPAPDSSPTIGSSIVLTEPGSSALSVTLAQQGGQLHAFLLEARTGLTALHARALTLGDPPRPQADRVLWVGGSAQPMTELHVMQSAEGVVGLIPLERDITHFGVALLKLGRPPWKEPHATWMTYPNGLEPAPIASAQICGAPVILLAKPSSAEPKAPQELMLLSAEQLLRGPSANTSGRVLARSRAFYDISIAALERGALLSYVADRRTWAMTLRCPRP